MDIHDELKAAIARAEAAEAEVKRLNADVEQWMQRCAEWGNKYCEVILRRDEAFIAGAEAMRETCIEACKSINQNIWTKAAVDRGDEYEAVQHPAAAKCEDAIRVLPIPAQEK